MKKIFLDTEFTGLHQKATLISIALVSDCGSTFYAEFTDYSKELLDTMGCKDDVLNGLQFQKFDTVSNLSTVNHSLKGNTQEIRVALTKWLNSFGEQCEVISDVLAYDWVLFCQIFDHAFNIPKNVYYIPVDFANLLRFKGLDPDLDRLQYSGGIENYIPHNALSDTLVLKKCYEKLMND